MGGCCCSLGCSCVGNCPGTGDPICIVTRQLGTHTRTSLRPQGPLGMPRVLLFFFGGFFFFVHIATWQLGTDTPTSLRPNLFW